jgi:hypothetical protein
VHIQKQPGGAWTIGGVNLNRIGRLKAKLRDQSAGQAQVARAGVNEDIAEFDAPNIVLANPAILRPKLVFAVRDNDIGVDVAHLPLWPLRIKNFAFRRHRSSIRVERRA